MMNLNGKLCLSAVLCCGLLFGCSGEKDDYSTLSPSENVENADPHEHHEHGPHGGHVVKMGDHTVEVSMGSDRVVAVYLLCEHATNAHPLENATARLHLHVGDQEQEVELTASPLESDKEGQCSRFVSSADAIPATIADVEGIEGEVIVSVDGQETTAALGHAHDDHAGHAH